MKKIGIIGAMEIEINILREEMNSNGSLKEVLAGSLVFYEGIIGGADVVVVKSGVGKVNAALCAQRLILQFGADCIINTGIAGSMAAGLGIFDLVASTDALYHDMDATEFGYKITQIPQMDVSVFPADERLIAAAEEAFKKSPAAAEHKMIRGRIATGDQFIADLETKQRIQKNASPACVEMEGAAIAHASYLNKTPYVILRCMSDMANERSDKSYNFNEKDAAEECAGVVLGMLPIVKAL